MPKKIGGRIYLHKEYIGKLPISQYNAVISAIDSLTDFQWNTVRLKVKGNNLTEIAFQYSPDFDIADEPEVTQTAVCTLCDGSWKVIRIQKHKDTIWHHKWMWVDSQYTGFDYIQSKNRSILWKRYVSKDELSLIGNKKFWNSIIQRFEN